MPLDARDRLLLALLLPLFGACFALHVHEVARSGLAQLPVWGYAGADGGPPIVGGYRLETDHRGSGLRPGDRLIRVGEHDLRGVGYLGFDALALEAARDGAARLVYERAGERGAVMLHPRPRPFPWSRVPGAALFALLSTVVLLRASERRDARRFFAAFMTYAIVQCQFYGGPAWQSWASLAIWNLGTPLSIFLVLHWAACFPAEVSDRRPLSPLWPLAAVAAWLVHRASYFLGGPIPPLWVAPTGQALNAAFLALTLAFLLRNYALGAPVARRRLKWVLYAAVVGALPLALGQLAVFVQPDWSGFEEAYAAGTLALGLSVLFLLVAMVRYNLFDVDRVLSATASYSVVIGAFLVGALGLLPGLAERLAARLPLEASAAQILLALLLAGALAPLHARLAPALDRFFFPERGERARGIDQLLRDLSECRSEDEVLELTAERLDGVVRPQHLRVVASRGARLEPLRVRGEAQGPGLAARGPLALALERDPRPRHLGEGGVEAALAEAAPAERAALEGVAVLLPIRRGKDLAAVVALGPLRSGDVYTATDRALLAAVADRASAELGRLRDAETITSERGRADELARLQAAAEEAHRSRSRFLAAASHDLRQPLHAVALYAGLLRERARGRDGAELAERIERSAGALSDMVSGLLDVSRLDIGAVEPRPEVLELDALLGGLADEGLAHAEARGLALHWHESGLRVRSDPVLLGRILRNLLVNALTYTDHGSVELAATRAGGEAVIEVRDTGPGIPEARQSEIFREFERLGRGASTPGLGLGLSIAERLARVLGHRLALVSAEGEGSCFRVSVPLAKHETEPLAAVGLPSGMPEGAPLVVVIDDDPTLLEASKALLSGWGWRTTLATGSEDAIRGLALRESAPDALLVDLDLGEERGEQAIDAVRAAVGFEVPAAILTGETARERLDPLRERGLPVAVKPLAPARLRALLAELVRGRR